MLTSKNFTKDASIIDEVSDTLIYVGFLSYGATATDIENCAIRKIEKVGTVWTMKWAEGITDKKFIWDNRATLNYLFLK